MSHDIDPRVDLSWKGPMPQYEATITLDASVSREDLLMYFSHTMAQVIDASFEAAIEEGQAPLRFPEGSPWDRNWESISSMGMTETEVSFLLSDLDGDALRNMANLAMGVALDQVLAEYGPAFMLYATATLLGMVANEGERYIARSDPRNSD